MLTCSKCGEGKPATAFYASCKSWCKACRRAASRAFHHANKERLNAKRVEWAQRNVDRENARKLEWARANPEKVSMARAAYVEANPERERGRWRDYHRRHPEKAKKRQARYRRRHPDRKRARDTVRHARRRAAVGRGVTAAEWVAIRRSYLGICAYCSRRKRLTMDHIKPLVSGGAHEPENIAPCCRSCNSSKNATPLVVWLAKGGAP